MTVVLLPAVALSLVAAGCSVHRGADTAPAAERFGIYKGVFQDDDGGARRFRVMLYAAPPDRLHVEVLAPVGGPYLILDGGGGRIAVTSPRDRVAWVGEPRPDVLERILGIDAGLDAWVAALLEGVEPGGELRVRRSPGRKGLPETAVLTSGDRRIELRLRRRRPLPGGAEKLGTGAPPEGVELRPLEDLTGDTGPAWILIEKNGEDP